MEQLSKNKIKFIRSLHYKTHRDANLCFLVEGEKMVTELLKNSPERIVFCIATEEFPTENFQDIKFYACTNDTLHKCSTLKTPNKVLAVVKKAENLPIPTSQFIIALDEIQDPGNMGTIMRLADWFGVQSIVCSPNTVDCFHPKVIQASMSAFMRVNVFYTDLSNYFQQTSLPIYGTFINGISVYQQQLSQPCILLMGNEGNGISKKLEQYITHRITIPRLGQAESLNVGTATAIFLAKFFFET